MLAKDAPPQLGIAVPGGIGGPRAHFLNTPQDVRRRKSRNSMLVVEEPQRAPKQTAARKTES